MRNTKFLIMLIFLNMLYMGDVFAQETTYAEKPGFEPGKKVVILHVDDPGMSYSSNAGAIKAITEGLATSGSMMMPCPWVPGMAGYMKEHPGMDIGLHRTLTSE